MQHTFLRDCDNYMEQFCNVHSCSDVVVCFCKKKGMHLRWHSSFLFSLFSLKFKGKSTYRVCSISVSLSSSVWFDRLKPPMIDIYLVLFCATCSHLRSFFIPLACHPFRLYRPTFTYIHTYTKHLHVCML